jgi:hypothetical protein
MMAGVCIAFIFQWKGSEDLCRRAFEVKTFEVKTDDANIIVNNLKNQKSEVVQNHGIRQSVLNGNNSKTSCIDKTKKHLESQKNSQNVFHVRQMDA